MIITLSKLDLIRKKHKNQKIVFAGGVFDVFHPSHIKTFKSLMKYGIVVIGIVSDKRVKERKGNNRPILKQKERQEIVDAIKYVDYVVQMPDPTKNNPIPTMVILEKLKPDTFVSVDSKWSLYEDLIKKMGIKLKINKKRISPISSTSIINRIVKRYSK